MSGKPETGSGTTDQMLVRSVLRGELSAFDQLVGRYQRQALAVAYRLLNNSDDALEVSQDAFLKAYDKLGTLSNHERFGSWLLRIVSNLSLNRRRSRALRKTISLDGDGDEGEMHLPSGREDQPETQARETEMSEIISEAMAELPEMQRQALVLFSVNGIPQKEVAKTLGCSVEAVKWHVFTARKKLKDQLKDYL